MIGIIQGAFIPPAISKIKYNCVSVFTFTISVNKQPINNEYISLSYQNTSDLKTITLAVKPEYTEKINKHVSNTS